MNQVLATPDSVFWHDIESGVSWTFSQTQKLAQNYAKELGPLIGLHQKEVDWQLLAYARVEVFALLLALWQKKQRVVLTTPPPQEQIQVLKNHAFDPFQLLTAIPSLGPKSKDDALIVMTSGSSGRPKAVVHTHAGLKQAALEQSQALGLTSAHRMGLVLPWHHIAGAMAILRCWYSGASIYQVPWKNYFAFLDSTALDFISLVPTQLNKLVTHLEKTHKSLNTQLIIGAQALGLALRNKAQALGLKIISTYGLSEMAAMVMIEGWPLKNTQVKTDDSGRLFLKSPSQLRCYLVNNEEIFPFDSQGFYISSDKAQKNPHGPWEILGRLDRVYISGGKNYSPELLENFLQQVPFVQRALALPLDDDYWGQRPYAFVQIDSTLIDWPSAHHVLTQKLQDFAREQRAEKLNIWPDDFVFWGPKINPNQFELLKRMALYEKDQKFCYSKHELISHSSSHRQRPLLVLLHGFLGNCLELLPLCEDLKDDFDIVLYDLPGHGQSLLPENLNKEELIKALAYDLKQYQRPLYLLGYSWGGRMALELKAQDLLDIKKTFLISSHPGLEKGEAPTIRFQHDQNLANKMRAIQSAEDHQNFLHWWYGQKIFGQIKSRPFYHDYQRSKQFELLHCQARALEVFSLGRQENLKDHLSDTALVVGACDQKFVSLALNLEHHTPLKLFIIPNASHALHLERKDEVKKLLLNFFQHKA